MLGRVPDSSGIETNFSIAHAAHANTDHVSQRILVEARHEGANGAKRISGLRVRGAKRIAFVSLYNCDAIYPRARRRKYLHLVKSIAFSYLQSHETKIHTIKVRAGRKRPSTNTGVHTVFARLTVTGAGLLIDNKTSGM